MSERPTFTPEEIVTEAKRAARDQFKNGVLEISTGHISDMVHLLWQKEFQLFQKAFCDELVVMKKELRQQEAKGDESLGDSHVE